MMVPVAFPRCPAVPAVSYKSLILLVPQCLPRGSRGCAYLIDFIGPEVPALSPPIPPYATRPLEGGARAFLRGLKQAGVRGDESLDKPRSRASVRPDTRPSRPQIAPKLICNHGGGRADDKNNSNNCNSLQKIRRGILTVCPHYVRTFKEFCDV